MAPAPNAGKVPSVRKLLKGTEMNDSFLIFYLVVFRGIPGFLRRLKTCLQCSGVLPTSPSSPSRIVEALVSVPGVVQDVLVFVDGLHEW